MWNSNDILTSQKLNEMEDFVSSKSTSYSKSTWQDEDIITADKLNNLENGVLSSNSSYSKHTWIDDEEITAVKLNNITSGLTFEVGDEIVKDGITSVCIYKAVTREDWGQYIFADKSHDLCYYISGSDYVNEEDTENSCINLEAKYGYEWGSIGTATNVRDTSYGSGLSNTNNLISKNLQPSTPGWPVLWDMVEQFRSSHSDDWCVLSRYELAQIYRQESYLENLGTSLNTSYWSSSEVNLNMAYGFYFRSGETGGYIKDLHDTRARLCFYL